MPDITMCMNDDCELKNTCYRHEAKAGQIQSWSAFSPNNEGICEEYWEIRNDESRTTRKNL